MSTIALKFSLWLYSILLLAYPLLFRWEYGAEMMQLFRDMLQEASQQRGCLGIVEVWLCVLPDWVTTVRQQRLLAGSYYRPRSTLNKVVQGVFTAIILIGGFVYWFYAK
jgi:hypothetical protein